MRLGIDFGTTRIVVAWADRGNYPMVSFEATDGSSQDWFPPLVAVQGDRRIYGWVAWAAQGEPGWTVVRSIKRALEASGPETRVQIADQAIPILQLLREMVAALRTSLTLHSTLPAPGNQPLEVMLGVPANANSNQRFLTVEAFRQGGFQVLGLLNEPSAAGVEFGHGERKGKKQAARILIYDLGGGTFDASLVEFGGDEQAVIASEGIPTLGGDNFDEILAELALESAALREEERESLSQAEMFRLLEECREKKESLHPNTRRVLVDLGVVRAGWQEVSVPVIEFYERCRALVEETLHATEDLVSGLHAGGASSASGGEAPLEVLYVTGGGSELPLVARMLRETFGRRVRRSAYTRSATAVGLAIQADSRAGYRLAEKFTRYFGVWREADGGRAVAFDPLFAKGMNLPEPAEPPLVSRRRYVPVHNVGHFRYLECSRLDAEGRPAGDLAVWDDIRFPFDSTLQGDGELAEVPVIRRETAPDEEAEESYSCDASGMVAVTITRRSDGYSRRYRLSRWSAAERILVPARPQKASRARSA
ncbi:MAG: Hsp70 family protein [Terriglobia bacterium]